MSDRRSVYRGCLLGLAVGDAMGYTVDSRSWEEIQRDYGPNGLLGYDLVNGYADVTSYTQLAAFTANGLLLGLTQGQIKGVMSPFVRYIGLGLREWAQSQRYRSNPGRIFCWLAHTKEMCARRCMDTFMLDTLSRERLGSMEEPVNKFTSPSSITTAVPVGLFSDAKRMDQSEIDRLAAEAIALTHGGPGAFLTGAVVAHLISGITADSEGNFEELVQQAIDAVQEQFGREYYQTVELWELLRLAITMAKSEKIGQVEAMEQLRCKTAGEVLAGAVYACLVSEGNFDSAMIVAVNHSGSSAAVGALTGAMLGTKLGEEALPDFYLECLEPAELLRGLADDLVQGCPMGCDSNLFDDDWDQKYIHGQPVAKGGWYEEL